MSVVRRWIRWGEDRAVGPRWWVPVAGGLLVLAASMAALMGLGAQLRMMHVPGIDGFGPQGFSKSHMTDAVRVWLAFWNGADGVPGASASGLASPKSIACHWFWIDLFLFTPAYVVAGSITLLRAARKSPGRMRAFASAATVALIAGALADVGENAFSLLALRSLWDGGTAWAGTIFWWTLAKSILLGFALAILLVRLVALWAGRGEAAKEAGRLLRGQIAIAAITVILFFVPLQLPDIFLSLRTEQLVALGAGGFLLGVTTWATARWMVVRREERGATTATPRPIPPAVVLAPVVAAAALALVNFATEGSWVGPVIPVGIAALVFVTGSFLERRDAIGIETNLGVLGVVLPHVLAVAGLTSAGAAAIRAAAALGVATDNVTSVWAAIGVVVVAVAVIGRVVYWLEHAIAGAPVRSGASKPATRVTKQGVEDDVRPARSRRLGIVVAVVTVLAVAATWTLLANRVAGAQLAGAGAAVFLFISGATLVLGMAVLAADAWTGRFGLPRLFDAVGSRAIPVFSLILVWGVAAAAMDDGRHWDVRKLGEAGATPVTLHDVYLAWEAAASGRVAPGDERRPIPLVFVAASGGGIRAAYWTALTMDCVFSERAARGWEDDNPCGGPGPSPEDVFLASGISGGSLGLVEWDASRIAGLDDAWVEDRLGEDFVAPTVAWGLMVEVPRSFLHFAADDRAEVLEESWEREWEPAGDNLMAEGFLEGQADRVGTGPLLMLNGSSVLDGCVLNVSILDEGRRGAEDLPLTDCTAGNEATLELEPEGDLPMTADLVDYLGCGEGEDVRRSTAALLSARFPYVSSAGRLPGCPGDSTKFVVDGGYLDTSAADPPLAAYLAIEDLIEAHNAESTDSCIVPYFLQVDNGYLDPVSPPRSASPPNQLLAPLQTLWASTGLQSRAERARTLAAETFTRPFPTVPGDPGSAVPGPRYALIVPQRHPGVEAPLGWTLSDASQRDLEDQLYTDNAETIETVKRWVTDPPACAPLSEGRPE